MENDFTELQKLIQQCNEAYYKQMPPKDEITEDEEIKLHFERFLNVISYLETLEDYMKMEQELGISFDILTRAITNGIFFYHKHYGIQYCSFVEFMDGGYKRLKICNPRDDFERDLELGVDDFRRTWGLTIEDLKR